jgi:hypothetical protein
VDFFTGTRGLPLILMFLVVAAEGLSDATLTSLEPRISETYLDAGTGQIRLTGRAIAKWNELRLDFQRGSLRVSAEEITRFRFDKYMYTAALPVAFLVSLFGAVPE